jgi:GH43 family beta-xylosidase
MTDTYLNPVYSQSFPDPFVLKYRNEYWAYCTGEWPDGRRFGVLRSRDLVHWQPLAGALAPLPEQHPHYWAPEVTYHNGHFYLYYSVGDEATMQMRVAVATHPAGPFVDSGQRLTSEPFAIDGHVLIDDDGSWYLFYATDFLHHSHIGTGTVRDRLLDPFTLAGQPQPVTLPCYSWHVYDPHRIEKGGVCWHTIEGSFVLKHKRRYYQMYSGGNWQNVTYGVSYALADQLDTPGEWAQVADGERVLPILRTIPGQVIGPGHNSVVRGPDNMQLYCIYHRWAPDSSARVMAIDALDWAGERMLVLGPSNTPQPAPNTPGLADFFDQENPDELGAGWHVTSGRWSVGGGSARQAATGGVARAEHAMPPTPSLIAEISARADGHMRGGYGLTLGGDAVLILIKPAEHALLARVRGADERAEETCFALPIGFDAYAYHLLRVELNGRRLRLALDGMALPGSVTRADEHEIATIGLATEDRGAEFAGLAVTIGWEDLFLEQEDPAAHGWQSSAAGWHITGDELCYGGDAPAAAIFKGPLLESYELVVSARLGGTSGQHGSYGVYPAARPTDPGPLLTVERSAGGWVLICHQGASRTVFPLPGFDAAVPQQLRLRKLGARMAIQWETLLLGEVTIDDAPARVGLYANQAGTSFDLVRVTAQNS